MTGSRDGRGSLSKRLQDGRGDPRAGRNQRSRLTNSDVDERQFEVDREGRLCVRLGPGLKSGRQGISIDASAVETSAPFRKLADETGGTMAANEATLELVDDAAVNSVALLRAATANNFATLASALNKLEEALRRNELLKGDG